ncbi:MAG: right-handed parallel beta-helix repeat-containing protein [Myxococcales bacterium]|nr:right-handed parallel beta-helix repeat-containing protein [Myxococcales bacterium]
MAWRRRILGVTVAALGLAAAGACGDGGGEGGAGGSGGGGDGPCGPGVATTGADSCDLFFTASGSDDTEAVQTGLIEAQSGQTLCFCPGSYQFNKELSLTVPDITLKGVGESREDAVLDFASQTVGDDGLTVTSDGFTAENLWVKNSPGNGIVVTGADGVIFRNLKVSWDAGSVTENGAYAVYPVKSKNVLIEDSEIIGAADAGVYVGQCDNALVRNNDVHGNVAGIEIENTTAAEVVNNKAYDNAAGILVFVLPNLEKKDGMGCKVHDNEVYDNNRDNFAEEGTVVASVPSGTGMLILASDAQEVHDNDIHDNESVGMLIVSHDTLGVLITGFMPDPETDGYPEGTYIHDNTFTNNGTAPQGAASFLGITPLEDVVWDGVEVSPGSGALCFGASPPSFRNFGGLAGISDPNVHSTDTSPHTCTGQTQPTIDL